MKITFAKRWVSVWCSYVCKCGHKFRRENRDWYTMNPFNTKSAEDCAKEISEHLKKKVRPCPKCKKEVKPLNS